MSKIIPRMMFLLKKVAKTISTIVTKRHRKKIFLYKVR